MTVVRTTTATSGRAPFRPRLRAAVVGAGYFGRFHAAKYAALSDCELVGVADIDADRAREVAALHGCRGVADYRELLDRVDAVSVVTPCASHYAIAGDFLRAGAHVLVEKPMTASLAEADDLIRLAQANDCVLQVGHQERIFVASLELHRWLDGPLEIVCERTTPHTGRSIDCSVVMDLMIHDIDFVQSLVPHPVVDVETAAGGEHRTRAALSFADGSVARLSADRHGERRQRVARVALGGGAIELDFLAHSCSHSQHGPIRAGSHPAVNGVARAAGFVADDDLGYAISAFVKSIREGRAPIIPAEDGRRALATALTIEAAQRPAARAASADS